MRRRTAPFRSCSSLGFGLLEENRRAVQRFARLCSLLGRGLCPTAHLVSQAAYLERSPTAEPTQEPRHFGGWSVLANQNSVCHCIVITWCHDPEPRPSLPPPPASSRASPPTGPRPSAPGEPGGVFQGRRGLMCALPPPSTGPPRVPNMRIPRAPPHPCASDVSVPTFALCTASASSAFLAASCPWSSERRASCRGTS